MISNSKYYSGFCFENEKALFCDYLEESEFNIAGFSYGAIKALEYVLRTNTRVNKLQLFSPAFFQNKDEKFKKVQLLSFKKDENTYIENFLKNVTYKSSKEIKSYFKKGNKEELEALLNYVWMEEKLNTIISKKTKIEVFLGNEDRIIDAGEAHSFFKKYAEVYYIKNAGHLL